MADLLRSLPVDETPLNHDEIHILQTLFKDENSRDLSTIFIELNIFSLILSFVLLELIILLTLPIM